MEVRTGPILFLLDCVPESSLIFMITMASVSDPSCSPSTRGKPRSVHGRELRAVTIAQADRSGTKGGSRIKSSAGPE